LGRSTERSVFYQIMLYLLASLATSTCGKSDSLVSWTSWYDGVMIVILPDLKCNTAGKLIYYYYLFSNVIEEDSKHYFFCAVIIICKRVCMLQRDARTYERRKGI